MCRVKHKYLPHADLDMGPLHQTLYILATRPTFNFQLLLACTQLFVVVVAGLLSGSGLVGVEAANRFQDGHLHSHLPPRVRTRGGGMEVITANMY